MILTTFLMISQQYHSINNAIITTITSIPAITPAITPKFTELLLSDTFCCMGVVESVGSVEFLEDGVESVGFEGKVGNEPSSFVKSYIYKKNVFS